MRVHGELCIAECQTWGAVYYPRNSVYRLGANSDDFFEGYFDLFKRLSCFAKAAPWDTGAVLDCYGASLVS